MEVLGETLHRAKAKRREAYGPWVSCLPASEARYPSEGVRVGDGVGGNSAFLPGETSRPPRSLEGSSGSRKGRKD